MKKIFAIVLIVIMLMGIMSACNTQIVDTTWHFDRAIIKLPNGEVIEGHCDSWRNYEESDQVQVRIDGVTYLTFSSNVVLISD